MIQLDVSSLSSQIDELVNNAINSIIQNPNWIASLKTLLMREITSSVIQKLDMGLVSEAVQVETRKFLSEQKAQSLIAQPGIADFATSPQLTVFDHTTVVENDFVANRVHVVNDAEIKGSLIVDKDLVIKGSINTDNQSWERYVRQAANAAIATIEEDLLPAVAKQAIEQLKESPMSADNIVVGTLPLLENSNTLTPSINNVGPLSTLRVLGETTLADTLSVAGRRVGINTSSPDRALMIYDDEVSVSIGKFRANTAFIGTTKLQGIEIGVNQQGSIYIGTDGSVAVPSLKIGGASVAFSTTTPTNVGSKGDIVFNTNIGVNDMTWGWVCLGGAKWRALKTA